jgi:hypothetical protein
MMEEPDYTSQATCASTYCEAALFRTVGATAGLVGATVGAVGEVVDIVYDTVHKVVCSPRVNLLISP